MLTHEYDQEVLDTFYFYVQAKRQNNKLVQTDTQLVLNQWGYFTTMDIQSNTCHLYSSQDDTHLCAYRI